MKTHQRYLVIWFVSQLCLGVTTSTAQDRLAGPEFQQRAMQHVRFLAELGTRSAGSENERKAAAYIRDRFKVSGLSVTVEPFGFDAFTLKKAECTSGEQRFQPSLLIFDPYPPTRNLRGELTLVDPDISRQDLSLLAAEGRIVATARPVNFFRVAMKKPQAIVYFQKEEYLRLKDKAPSTLDINVEGETRRYRSANVVATLTPDTPADKEIIISAHMDSYNGPGADDNASGVAVLLELADHFAGQREELPCRLKFIAFGAEELGMLGSKRYLHEHSQELQNCELVFNLDTVGGSDGIYVEMRGGISGISPEKGRSQLHPEMLDKAGTDFSGAWRLLHPDLTVMASCVPEWLKQNIEAAGRELGLKINPSNLMGSDHLVFAQAGIPASDIAITGNKHHSLEDTLDLVNPVSLSRAARIAADVVERTLAGLR